MEKSDKSVRPKLTMDIAIDAFDSFYWMKDELIAFARSEGLRTDGYKPQLTDRIRRHLLGKPSLPEPVAADRGRRDSDGPLTRDTLVVIFKSDEKTRAFFKAELGPEFHFTYKMNKFRRSHSDLTYGDLIDEWLAERHRRKDKNYKPALEKHGEYNLFIRAFFADPENHGKSMRDAAASWNTVKPTQNRSYENDRSLAKKRGGA